MIASILIFCSCFLFFLWIYVRRKERKDRIREMFLNPPLPSRSNHERRTALAAVTRFLRRNFNVLFPSESEMPEFSKLLIRADLERYTAEELFALRYIFASIFIALFFLGSSSGANFALASALGATGGVCGFMLPLIFVKLRAEGRQARAQKELLDYIELLSTATEAGLTIQDAIRRVAEFSPGVLSDEFRRVWTIIHGGASRSQALQSLAARLDVEDITTFIDDILYSEKQGTPLSQAMKRQAERIREKTKLTAVENAQRATGKMMFPTVGLIFIPMIVLVMAPLLITLGKSFNY